jgi:hypothetical protein
VLGGMCCAPSIELKKFCLGRRDSDWEEDVGKPYKWIVRNVVNQNYEKSSHCRSWYSPTKTVKW